MTEDDFKERSSWAINYVCDKKGEYRHSNDSLGAERGVDKGTISSYRLKRTAPSVAFCVDFCKKFNKFSYEWLTLGKGEPFPGARDKFPEVCGPEEKADVQYAHPEQQISQVNEAAVNYRGVGVDPFRAMEQLSTILKSRDSTYIQAIVANLNSFAAALEQKKENHELRKEINELKKESIELKRRLDKIEAGARREGGAEGDDTSAEETGRTTAKKAG